MADTIPDDVTSKRESHFNHQRSSLRSSIFSESSAGPSTSRARTHSDLRRLDDFDLDLEERENADTFLSSPTTASSPAPNVPYTRQRDRSDSYVKRREKSTGKRISRSTAGGEEDLLAPSSWLHLYNENATSPNLPPPLRTPRTRGQSGRTDTENASRPASQQRSRRPSFPLGRITPNGRSASQLDITALPSMSPDQEENFPKHYSGSKPTPQAQRASLLATELYTISYLIFFAIWGTLARLGLQALTFYPGAPVTFSELWANVAGTFIMGFLSEDRRLFAAEWGNRGDAVPEPLDLVTGSDTARAKARHGKVKKTIPMYIGLATGFCGSFTSFSSFMRDIFLSLSNDLRSPINHPYPPNTPLPSVSTTVSRSGGYSFMAILATIILTISSCYAALKVGSHFALFLHPYTPTLPFRFTRRVVDPLFVLLGWGCWIATILLSIFPPHDTWRSQALFACVFAPVGCLLRYYISLFLNPINPAFPLGTFTVNIFGTAVLGMAYDLQHVQLSNTGLVGGSIIGCQILQGIIDGFCGCLTTVSTWIVELDTLKRRAAYIYGTASVLCGLGLLVIIMGSVRWTVGFSDILCTT
jgi:CrcB protein